MANETKLRFYRMEVMHSINQAASKKMLAAVNEVRSTVLETLSGTRTGRTYKVPGTNRTYTASAPGEAPAQATAELRQSIGTSIESEPGGSVGKVGTNKIQGKMMEFGTRNVAPRPWLRKSFEKAEGKVRAILGGRWF